MLAPVNDPKLATLVRRLHSALDIPAFFQAVKAILHEAMPGRRNLTARDKALLRALSPHVEATARKLNSMEFALDTQELAAAPSEASDVPAQLHHLTPAERDIVELVREGWSNKEIACQLDKSVRTVKTQLTSVYKKCDVRGRSRLLAKLS